MGIPYKESKYYRHRQRSPIEFKSSSFRTVPISHTAYRGKKFARKGVKAIVGKHKKSGKWKVQSILEPKPKNHRRKRK